MPRAYNRVSTVSRLDQLMAHLRRTPIWRSSISARQSWTRSRTTRSTTAPILTGTTAAPMSAIPRSRRRSARWFPQLETIPLSAFEETQHSEPGGDLPLLLGMRPYFWDRYVDLELKRPLLWHAVSRRLRPLENSGRVVPTSFFRTLTSDCLGPSCSATRSRSRSSRCFPKASAAFSIRGSTPSILSSSREKNPTS